MAINGDTAVVAAYPTRFNSGFAYWFTRSGGTWKREGSLDGGQQDSFGSSLAVSGRNIVIGAPWGYGGGAVYLFRDNGRSLDKSVIFYEDLIGPMGAPGANLGAAVSVQGNSIIAGAPDYSGFAPNAGLAAMIEMKFGILLMPPFVRFADESFHFSMIEAEPGTNYVLESASNLDADWIPLKEFLAYSNEIQLQVNFSPEPAAAFFRVRERSAAVR